MLSNTEQDLIEGILKNGPVAIDNALVSNISVDLELYIKRCFDEKLDYPMPITEAPTTRDWFIPNEYKDMDIEAYLIDQCPKENYERLILEIELYKKNNMLDILKVMKYLVDTFRKNKIVWGVGRGSSVSSYCLYLIGIHKIDSVKYNLPISDFFKGE
jgi:DNA polymerase III alpha subunit